MTIGRGEDWLGSGRCLQWMTISVPATRSGGLLEPIPTPQQLEEGEGWQPAGYRLDESPGSIPVRSLWVNQVFPWVKLSYTHVATQRFVREISGGGPPEWGHYRDWLGT